ncbi:apolipoprotein N-acyltransferase [Niveispirillum lacus]|uniref:Apolipoprotein N-acyltransferase n=1 Tax=Niveispirillum lacus TaxID=1981099 RepID=A0A255YVZ9_9PROT|nr:apolipoprotein N-acyltransferase [Niveispirillum lacus]OYQ33351.1 apolipoprotein N-acyltransferase [Niveispirillum lacus]
MTATGAAFRLATLAGWFINARGGKRLGLAALAGALATLSLPPAHALPLLWFAFPVLAWLLRGSDRWRSDFAIGLAFAVGHHVPGLYWISAALFTDIGRFWFMLPFALVGLPALLGLFLGVGTAVYGWARRRFGLSGWAEAVALALTWVAVEYARGHLLTGFPWNLIGYGWTPVLPVLQITSVTGIYGLSLLTVLIAVLPAAGVGARPSWRPALAGLAVLALVAGWGGWRMAGQGLDDVPGVTLRIVQPNIPQALKWKEDAKLDNLRRLITMSGAEGWDRVTHVVWPETAVPYFLSSSNDDTDQLPLTRMLTQIAPPGGALITGANRLATGPDGNYVYFNSLFALTQGGQVVASFDKFHLVPFGEYLPLRSLLPKGMKAVAAGADFSAGPGPRPLLLPGVPAASPLICYEVIFPGAVMPRDGERPHWLLNLTNDAWYGQTAGPHQHFAITIVRAVEEGVPLVRAANTGISGVVDAYGRVRGALPLGDSGNLDISLPQRAVFVPLYADYGDMILGLMWLSLLLAVVWNSWRRQGL